ncbi:hypothetical protein H4219_002792 [Mycoemilia scoparia]|uniref:Uncharacterized protein n=1 Tax=Mycoemilia scoparia TaxID=417184 RepID=A0A9W8A1P7_9FUNG|nr:hypothetical protein H4219_002792 [Mycoemilia scoparia]
MSENSLGKEPDKSGVSTSSTSSASNSYDNSSSSTTTTASSDNSMGSHSTNNYDEESWDKIAMSQVLSEHSSPWTDVNSRHSREPTILSFSTTTGRTHRHTRSLSTPPQTGSGAQAAHNQSLFHGAIMGENPSTMNTSGGNAASQHRADWVESWLAHYTFSPNYTSLLPPTTGNATQRYKGGTHLQDGFSTSTHHSRGAQTGGSSSIETTPQGMRRCHSLYSISAHDFGQRDTSHSRVVSNTCGQVSSPSLYNFIGEDPRYIPLFAAPSGHHGHPSTNISSISTTDLLPLFSSPPSSVFTGSLLLSPSSENDDENERHTLHTLPPRSAASTDEPQEEPASNARAPKCCKSRVASSRCWAQRHGAYIASLNPRFVDFGPLPVVQLMRSSNRQMSHVQSPKLWAAEGPKPIPNKSSWWQSIKGRLDELLDDNVLVG